MFDVDHLWFTQPSGQHTLLAFFGTIFTIWIIHKFIIYPNFICPTRHIPGPYITKCTSFWLLHHGFWDTANQWILSVHEKYGPVVTLSPTEVSFNTIDVIPTIYGVRSDFHKSPSVAAMNNYNKPNTFSSVANVDHRRRRARYAGVYSKTNMTTGQAYASISHRTVTLLDLIRSHAQRKESVDIYKLFHYYSIDNASLIASGTSPNLLQGQDCDFSTNLRTMFLGLAAVSYFDIYKHIKTITNWLPSYLQPPLLIFRPVKVAYEAHEKVERFNLAHFERSRSEENPELKDSVMARLLQHGDFESEDLSILHVASEISDHLLAGADTLVASLTYTVWELARPENKIHLERLRTEVSTLELKASGIPKDYSKVDALTWLDCCIKEGLRLHTPSGHIQIRSVPLGGATLAGYFVPEHIEVGIPLYAIQLNARIFHRPLEFNPARWLPADENAQELSRMNKAFMTFGFGARVCVGKELALVQSKLLLAMLYSQFGIRLDERQDQREMEGVQAAVLAPRGARCLLRFEERGELEREADFAEY